MGGQIHGTPFVKPGAGQIIILTGTGDAGKTTLCLRLLEGLRHTNLIIKGVLSPPREENGTRIGIDLLDIEKEFRQPLATLRSGDPGGLSTIRWKFEEGAMETGNHILKYAVPCDLLVIDELGPLEFERSLGWLNGLKAVDSREYNLAIVVIRPSLIEKALHRWPGAEVIDVTRASQSQVLAALLKLVSSISPG